MNMIREFIADAPAVLVGGSVFILAFFGYYITQYPVGALVNLGAVLGCYLLGLGLKWVLRVSSDSERVPNTNQGGV